MTAAYDLGFGNPVDALVKMAAENKADLLVMGGHGHRGVEDLFHGTTVTALRHRLAIPVMVVPRPGLRRGRIPPERERRTGAGSAGGAAS